jgi:hypothetical protein
LAHKMDAVFYELPKELTDAPKVEQAAQQQMQQ